MLTSKSHGTVRPIGTSGAAASRGRRVSRSMVQLCLTKPGKIAVHRLRTSTRRVQAQLELLSMLPALPPHDAAEAQSGPFAEAASSGRRPASETSMCSAIWFAAKAQLARQGAHPVPMANCAARPAVSAAFSNALVKKRHTVYNVCSTNSVPRFPSFLKSYWMHWAWRSRSHSAKPN